LADDVRAALVREGPGAFFRARAEALQRHFPALVPGENPGVNDEGAERNADRSSPYSAELAYGATGESSWGLVLEGREHGASPAPLLPGP